jgi:hypothetical protein
MNASIGRHHKLLAALIFVAGLFVSSDTNAHWGWGGGWHGGGWHGGGWHQGWGGWGGGIYLSPLYTPQIYYRNCGWVGGHWQYGYWVPAHRACWY